MKKIFTVAQVRNENDIIESFCRYNLSYCDGMLIRDNGSSDNTKEIIQSLINEGLPIYWVEEKGQINRAKKAIDEFGADLIIPLDADEFLYHIDCINPRETLEMLQEDIEYQAIWRTYIYEKEPDIALGFMPNNFTHYRNPVMEDPAVYERHKKVIVSKYLIKECNAIFVVGSHFLIYPENYANPINIEICNKLVFAHFPIRSKAQVMKKVIPNWIYKWNGPGRIRYAYLKELDLLQDGVIFNGIKSSGELKEENLSNFSINYAMFYDCDKKNERRIKSIEDIENIKKELKEEFIIYNIMNTTFCSEKLNLIYTNYINDDNKSFFRATLSEIYKTISYLASESDERENNLIEASSQYKTLEQQNNVLEQQNNILENQNNVFKEQIFRITQQLTSIKNSRSWRFTKPLRKLTAFVRKHRILCLFAKGLLSIKRIGIFKTFRKIKKFFKINLIRNKSSLYLLKYESEYQENVDFSKYKPKVKAIAFYLPQFHAIPENDKWWGKGFTEWTNTRKAKPRFKGHYQPREPHEDFGYYNLTDVKVLKKQAELAKQHGIYGFCFYLYWFSGRRLLEKPLDLFLEHQDIDIKFCLCWANENWTRTWDGLSEDILIRQEYTIDDQFKFINDIKKYIDDKRYIMINNEPIIIVYHPGQIPNIKEVFSVWRKHAFNIGIGKIKILICRTFGNTINTLDLTNFVDGEIEFPPHEIFINQNNIDLPEIKGKIYNYNEIIEFMPNLTNNENNTINDYQLPIYRTSMMGWDNTARRGLNSFVFNNFSLNDFYNWTKLISEDSQKENKKYDSFIFINAWNEWAEGTYLEPDKKYGYANINTFSKAINGLPFTGKETYKYKYNKIIFICHDACQNGAQLLALNIIKQLTETFNYNVYLILKNGGPLINKFTSIAFKTICSSNVSENDLKNWIKMINVDKAISNTIVTGDILHFLSECGVSCISLIHEMERVILQYSCEKNLKFIIKDANKIVFSSNHVVKSIEKIVSIPKDKIIIHPQGLYNVNPYLKRREEIRSLIRSKYNIPNNSKIILGVGFADYRKGIDLFVKCMQIVCKDYQNIYFIWVGDIEPSLLFEVKLSLDGSIFKNRFICTGWEDDSMQYFIAADIYLLTSREDPFPSVVLEAMYAYLPVIAFEDGGGYVEIINNKTGHLVPMENVDAMSEYILKLVNDDSLCLKIGQYSHELVKERFNFLRYIYYLFELLKISYKKISVIIPNYNYGKYLKDRIDSILSQTYPIFEIIILDDCSKDNSIYIINDYIEKYPLRIKSIINNENSGNVFKQWKKGIEVANGDYIWIAEADDLSEPIFVESLIKRMSIDEKIIMGYTQSKIINEYGKIISENYLFYTDEIDTIWRSDYITDGIEEIEKRLSIKNTILNVSAVLFKNNNLLNIIKEAENFHIAGDWRLYIDLLKDGGKIAFLADNLNKHRRHSKSVTLSLNNKIHFNEICKMQDYIYKLTKNLEYFTKAKNYRKKLIEDLNIKM